MAPMTQTWVFRVVVYEWGGEPVGVAGVVGDPVVGVQQLLGVVGVDEGRRALNIGITV